MFVILYIPILFFAYIFLKKMWKSMASFDFEKKNAEKFSKNIFLKSKILKSEVKKKWFEILKLPFYKKIEFFKNVQIELEKNKYFVYFLFFSFLYFALFLPWISFILYKIFWNYWLFSILFLLFYYFYVLYNYKVVISFSYFLKKDSLENFSWIKSNFLIIFENNAMLDWKKFPIKNWDLTTNWNLMNLLQKNQDLNHYDFAHFVKMEKIINFINKKYRIINNFQKNIKILDEKLENLENISKSLEKNISENNEVFHKSFDILKNFKVFDEKIIEILNLKKIILENFEKITNDKNLDLKKFDFYVLEKILNPILKLKNILENNLEKAEKILNETKKDKNIHIKFSEKMLEITKNNLQKQIFFLDEKLKFLQK